MFANEVSLVLAARAPKKLAQFYAQVLEVKQSMGFTEDHWLVLHPNGMKLHIFNPSHKSPLNKTPGNFGLCIHGKPQLQPLSTIEKRILELVSMGARPIGEAKLESFGAEIWMMDPEDNHFLLLIPSINS